MFLFDRSNKLVRVVCYVKDGGKYGSIYYYTNGDSFGRYLKDLPHEVFVYDESIITDVLVYGMWGTNVKSLLNNNLIKLL